MERGPSYSDGNGRFMIPAGHTGNASPGTGKRQKKLSEEDIQEKLAILEREAYEKGFEQGRRDGLDLEKKQMEEQKKQIEALFNELHNLKGSLLMEAEQDALKLCMAIAERVIGHEILTNPDVISHTIRESLHFVSNKSQIRISINPDDMDEVQKLVPELVSETNGTRFQIIEDRAVQRGGCIMETGFGTVNATIADQCSVLENEVDRLFMSGPKSTHETSS
jgi:flagellar biosynthesis/type III secretory pathway protein FliH